MDSRKDIDRLAITIVALVSLIWGLQQVFVKAVASDMSPVLQIALRSGIAAVLLTLVMLWRKESLINRSTFKPGIIAGLLFSLEFFFVGEGLRHTTASHMVVFMYTAPIFVAFCLHFTVKSEQLKPLQWLGIIVAFVGISLTFLLREAESGTASAPNMLWGDLLAIFGAISWAATTVLVRKSSLATAPATQTLWYQLIVSFVVIFIVAIVTGQTQYSLTPSVMGNLVFQGIIVTFASYLIWFWLLRQYSASQLGVFTFMTPMFGIGFGVWILNEPLEVSFIYGAILVMMGIVLVNGHKRIASGLKLILRKPAS